MGIEGVSYGGQLSDWLITQTNEFKAAVPIAGITNMISYNYIDYYNQYEEMEFGQFLHQGTTMDEAWKRSAIRYVAQVHTPTMLVHGENDPDVPIEEAEQYYVALKDVGVETVFVRYPREGHGLAETGHIIDNITRKFHWYEDHFPNSRHRRRHQRPAIGRGTRDQGPGMDDRPHMPSWMWGLLYQSIGLRPAGNAHTGCPCEKPPPNRYLDDHVFHRRPVTRAPLARRSGIGLTKIREALCFHHRSPRVTFALRCCAILLGVAVSTASSCLHPHDAHRGVRDDRRRRLQ